MNPRQKDAYIAESLFMLRRVLPVLIQKMGSSASSTNTMKPSYLDAFKKDPNFNCFRIDNDTKLNEATDKLKKKGFKEKLTNLLLSKKCEDINETGRRMCSFIFTGEFGQAYSMQERKKKKPFLNLSLVTLIKTALGIAYCSKKPPVTEDEQHSAINAWLKYCSTRIKQKTAASSRHGNQLALLLVSEDEEEELQDN